MDTLYLVFKDRFSIQAWMHPNPSSCLTDELFSPQANAHSNQSPLTCQALYTLIRPQAVAHHLAANFRPNCFEFGSIVRRESLSPASTPFPDLGRLTRSRNPQNASVVPVKAILHILQVIVFVFHSDGECLIIAAALDPQWQIPLQIGTAITRIVLLIMLVVSEHVDPVEIRLFQLVRFA